MARHRRPTGSDTSRPPSGPIARGEVSVYAEPHASSRVRCAIYTRKSSEEGLEQAFNSLHAQREACEAYILSQRHEGWMALPTAYDDGGYSGGSMERPALKQLVADLGAGLVDVVVVYKIDRLTRSLFDFARIVETLDAAKASFVSVTQSFNTTTSMGRLTLNVLLSFAQFEREVTGERIRDKIAASRAKGMFMGGNIPLGYDLQDHQLVPNETESDLVRFIFDSWLQHGSMQRLKRELDRRGARTRQRPNSGGLPFGLGHLRWILTNPVYVGLVRHKGKLHPGRHPAIVEQAVWEQVEQKLAAKRQAHHSGADGSLKSLLAGRLQDHTGLRYTATHAGSRDKRYRYYVAESSDPSAGPTLPPRRLPASVIETIVVDALVALLSDPNRLLDALRQPVPERKAERRVPNSTEDSPAAIERALAEAALLAKGLTRRGWRQHSETLRAIITGVVIHPDRFDMVLNRDLLRSELGLLPGPDNTAEESIALSGTTSAADAATDLVIPIPVSPPRRHRHGRLVIKAPDHKPTFTPDPTLVEAIDRARRWYLKLLHDPSATLSTIAADEGKNRGWVSSQIQLAFLPPDLEEAIRQGRQPEGMSVRELFDVAREPRREGRRSPMPV